MPAFNRDCADWVYDTIVKMDDDEAAAFGLFVVHDLWSTDMAANDRLVSSYQERQDAVYTEDVAKALLEHLDGGGDPDEAVAVAAAVAVAKADHDKWKFQARDKAGRFGRMTGAQYRASVAGIKANDKKARADLKAERKGYLGGGGLYVDARDGGAALTERAGHYADRFNRAPNSEMSGETDTFGRLSAGGALVQEIGAATGSNKTAIAGAVANYAGQFGPEAEKVVGPSMRRAAYRYRGTERAPDRAFVSMAQENLNSIKQPGEPTTPEMKVFAAENTAVQYFLGESVGGRKGKSRVPSARLSGLHRASGRITPSEGILIDAKGNIAHQAVGFGEDHYLPFNLKNLGALKGGSYVRTRESGGLTTEDVYTGLVSGARSMTVVSNSGVFTVDFADDLRGGRRYNDKARQMVKRYGQTLDAIQSEQVANPERSLSGWEKAHIRLQAESKVNSDPFLSTFSSKEKDAWIDAEVKNAEQHPRLSAADIEGIEAAAKEQGKTLSDQQVLARQMYDEKTSALSQRNYRLDGQGYATALEALQEQFPYYIGNVNYRHIDSNDKLSPDRFNRGVDHGYVKPRYNRPEGARAGYYDESITGQGKRGADQTGYQNAGVRNKARARTEEQGAAAAPAPKGETPDEARSRMANKAKESEEQQRYGAEVGKDAGVWLDLDEAPKIAGALNVGDHDVLDHFKGLDDDGRKRFLTDPTQVNALAKDLDALEAKMGKDLEGAQIPRNRKNFARKAKSTAVASIVAGTSSPLAPPSADPAAIAKLAEDPAFVQMVQSDDEALRVHSDKLRTQRAGADDPKPFDAAIAKVETARAAKATGRAEVTREEYDAETEKRTAGTGTLTPVPKVSGGGGFNDRLIRLRDQHQKGLITSERFHGDVKDLIDDSDLSDAAKDGLHFELTGNRRR